MSRRFPLVLALLIFGAATAAARLIFLSVVAAAQNAEPAAYFPPVLLPHPSAASAPHAQLFDVTANGLLSVGAVAVDSNRNIFIAGIGTATEIPGLNRGFQPKPNGYDAFIAKLDARGEVLWSTYLGGTDTHDLGETYPNTDAASSIAVDAAGNVYVAGQTGARNFPTLNAFRPTTTVAASEGFAAKISASGTLLYSTLLGTYSHPARIAVGPAGEAWILTNASDRVPAMHDLSPARRDFYSYLTKLNPSGSPVWTTRFWFGYHVGFGVDGAGRPYLIADEGLSGSRCRITVTQLDTSGSAVLYESTFEERVQQGASCTTGTRTATVTADGRVIVAGLGCDLRLPARRAPSVREPSCSDGNGNQWVATLTSSGEVAAMMYADTGQAQFVASDSDGRIILMSARASAGLPAVRALLDHHVDGPIYVSSDRGETWQAAEGVRGESFVQVRDFEFDAARNSVYATFAARPSLYESPRAGRMWQRDSRPRELASIGSIAVDPRDPSIRYASSSGNIFRHDANSDWQVVVRSEPAFNVGWFPVEANRNDGWIWAGAPGAWAFSFDSGRSWFRKHFLSPTGTILTPALLAFHPTRPGTMYATATNASGGQRDVYGSRDNGDTWQPLTAGLGPNRFMTSVAIDPVRNLIYAGEAGFPQLGVLQSGDEGQTWTSKLPRHRITALAVDPTRSNIVYAGGTEGFQRAVLYRSTDAGETWQRTMTGLHVRYDISRLFVDPSDSSRVYLGAQLRDVPYIRRLVPGRSMATRTDFATYLGHGTATAITVGPTGEILVLLNVNATGGGGTATRVAVVVIEDRDKGRPPELMPAPRRP